MYISGPPFPVTNPATSEEIGQVADGGQTGLGPASTPPRFLDPGDVVELGIEGLGEARQSVVAWSRQSAATNPSLPQPERDPSGDGGERPRAPTQGRAAQAARAPRTSRPGSAPVASPSR